MNVVVLSLALSMPAACEGQAGQQNQPAQPAPASQVGQPNQQNQPQQRQQQQNQTQQAQPGQAQRGQAQPGQAQPGQAQQRSADGALRLDGQWNIVYAEMDGQRTDPSRVTNISIRDNVVTCRQDGQVKQYRLEFGPHHMVRCTALSGAAATTPTAAGQRSGTDDAHSHHGVYVAGQDFLALSLNKGAEHSGQAQWTKEEPKGADLVLILRRGGPQGAGLTSAFDGQMARRSGYFEPAMQQTRGALVIFLPRPDAQVWIDDFQTQQQGTQRTYETPPLQQPGTYTVRARWMENGQPVTREQTAQVRAGRWTTVEFRSESQQGGQYRLDGQPANQNNGQQGGAERVPGGQINNQTSPQQQQQPGNQPNNQTGGQTGQPDNQRQGAGQNQP